MKGDWATLEIIPSGGDPRVALFEEIVRQGWKLREFSAHEASLEEIFTSLVASASKTSSTPA